MMTSTNEQITTDIIAWFSKVWDKLKFSQYGKDQIKDHLWLNIVYVDGTTEEKENVAAFGEVAWDLLTTGSNYFTKTFPALELDTSALTTDDWYKVGHLIIELTEVELAEYEDEYED